MGKKGDCAVEVWGGMEGVEDIKRERENNMKFYCDGSGWNGQMSKFGILRENWYSTMIFDKPLSNNVMEYGGIIMAAIVASDEDEIISDSQLAVNQIAGVFKTKEPSLIPLRQAASALIQGKHLKLKWMPREKNKADKIV